MGKEEEREEKRSGVSISEAYAFKLLQLC